MAAPDEVEVALHHEVLSTTTGVWCPQCLLPSAWTVEGFVTAADVPCGTYAMTYCDDHHGLILDG